MLTAAPEADEHLDDAGELVLRAGGVCGGEVPGHAEDVDGGGALHRGALSHREEVVAITAGASRVALGEEELLGLVTSFYPLPRIERLEEDRSVGSVVSYAERFAEAVGRTVHEAVAARIAQRDAKDEACLLYTSDAADE